MSSPDLLISDVLYRVAEANGETFLDCACGFGKWGMLIRHSALSQGKRITLVGFDIWKPYLKEIKSFKLYDDLILCHLAFFPFRENTFDVVLISECLEHLEKKFGLNTIKDAKVITKKRLIITTPNVFYRQAKLRGNPWEEHKSSWSPRDFKRLGFRVYGFGCKIYFPGKGIRSMPLHRRGIADALLLLVYALGSLIPAEFSSQLLAIYYK